MKELKSYQIPRFRLFGLLLGQEMAAVSYLGSAERAVFEKKEVRRKGKTFYFVGGKVLQKEYSV